MHVFALLRTYQQVDRHHAGARPQQLLDQQLTHETGTTSEEDALAIVKLLDRCELLIDQRRTLRRCAFRWRAFRRWFRYAVRFDNGHFLAIDSVQQHFYHLCDRWHLQWRFSVYSAVRVPLLQFTSDSYSQSCALWVAASNLKMTLFLFRECYRDWLADLRRPRLLLSFVRGWREVRRRRHDLSMIGSDIWKYLVSTIRNKRKSPFGTMRLGKKTFWKTLIYL